MDTKWNILLIDDEEPIHDLIEEGLKNIATIHHASDAFEAQQKVAKNHYDVLLCDIMMPMLSGFILIEEFHKKGISLPVIFISGEVNRDISRQALALGAFHILQKPFSMAALRDKVNEAASLAAMAEKEAGPEASQQELGYYYNLLKPHYYNCEKIIHFMKTHKLDLAMIPLELEKKVATGHCLLDDPTNLKKIQ